MFLGMRQANWKVDSMGNVSCLQNLFSDEKCTAVVEAVVLSCDDRPTTPRNGVAIWHALDDAQSFVVEEVIVHSLLPVKQCVDRCVAGSRYGRWVNMYRYLWALHTW